MATYSDVMKWVAKLDTSDVLKGFKEIEGEGKDALEGVGDSGEKLEGRFSGIGGKMGKAMVAGFAAIGVGALLLQGIEEAFNRKDALNVVTARFDLTAQEAEKYGKIAGDLYYDGWGEGFEQVQDAAALVGERLKITNEQVISDLTTQALTVQKVWGEDVDAVLRSVSQLLENDLVDSAQHGMDLIVTAFQNGGNEAGDLLDTIDEYSQHFETMGLSGEDAMNILVAGIQNGQRDTDKLADAIKELRIRAVEDTDAISDAYDDLGLDADELRRKFLAGGDEAREAFLTVIGALNDVEDPIEQNRLAVEFLGTQFEDLGPKALDALDDIVGKLGEVEGAAEDAAEDVEAIGWDKLQRRGEQALGVIGDHIASKINPGIDGAIGLVDNLSTGFGMWGDSGEDESKRVSKWVKEMAEEAIDAATAIESTEGALEAESRAAKDAAEASRELQEETKHYGAALGTLDEELEAIRSNTQDTTDATNEYAEAMEEAADRAEELQQRHRRLKDELSGTRAFMDVKDGFAAIGGEAEITERDILDLRDTVADYIAGLDNIPPEVLTQIDALVNQGAYDQALAQLNELERTRTTQINIRTQYSQAGSSQVPVQPGGGLQSRQADSAIILGATGGIVNRPTMAMIGEAGPEAVIPLDKSPGNGPLPSNLGGGEVSIHIETLTTQARNGQQLLDELTAAVRRQGPSGIRRALGID